MARVVAQPNAWTVGLWGVFVTAAAAVAWLPGDPGSVPGAWLVVLAVLGVLASRGSRTAHAALVALNLALLATVLLLAGPVAPAIWTFYALVAAALTALIGLPLLGRSRSAVQQVC